MSVVAMAVSFRAQGLNPVTNFDPLMIHDMAGRIVGSR